MSLPGLFSLGDFAIGANATQIGDWVDIEGALAALVSLRLAYGSAGGTVKAYVQTSADDGTTATDIACVTFTTAGKHALLNFSALTPKTTAAISTDGSLADDTAVDGLLGTKARLKVVSSGTAYAGSTVLSARLTAR